MNFYTSKPSEECVQLRMLDFRVTHEARRNSRRPFLLSCSRRERVPNHARGVVQMFKTFYDVLRLREGLDISTSYDWELVKFHFSTVEYWAS